jgi:hypothetical protein
MVQPVPSPDKRRGFNFNATTVAQEAIMKRNKAERCVIRLFKEIAGDRAVRLYAVYDSLVGKFPRGVPPEYNDAFDALKDGKFGM